MDFGWAFSGLMSLNYVFPLIFFFGMGWMYMVILVCLQDAIDDNEYRFGDRKESIISAWRPLDVKLSSALLRGFQFLIFLVAGVSEAYSMISSAESEYNIATATGGGQIGTPEYEKYLESIAAAEATVTPEKMRVFGILVVALLLLSILGAYVSIHFFYKLDEEEHQKMVDALAERNASAEAQG